MECAFLDYWTQIDNGEIVACEKIKKVAKKLLYNYYHPGKFHFDLDKANVHVNFIEYYCTMDDGNGGKIPFKLELPQKAWLETIYGFVDDDGYRQYNEVLLMIGRKNGKTSLVSALEVDALVNSSEPSPEIYNVATSKEQAKKGFNSAWDMIKRNEVLDRNIRKRAGDLLYYDYNFGFIRALASNTSRLDGLCASFVCLDEMAAYTKRDLYDLMKQSTGSRKQPLTITITTNGFVRENIFDAQFTYACKVIDGTAKNERFLPLLYELDSKEEYTDESCWIKANPLLGTVKSWEYMREQVQKALDDESYKPTVMCKEFDLPETSVNSYLTYKELYNDEIVTIEQLREEGCKYFVGGFDKADSVDLNAAVALFKRPRDNKYYAYPMFWIPESVIENQRKKGSLQERDKVPYELWISQGYMRTYPGNKCSGDIFLNWFAELREKYKVYGNFCGFDPWHIDDTNRQNLENFFGKGRLIPVRQGVQTMSQPMKDLKAEFASHNIVYSNNPILQWCLYNTNIKRDVNDNIQPIKTSDRTQRIDGAIALICAFITLNNNINDYLALNKPKK